MRVELCGRLGPLKPGPLEAAGVPEKRVIQGLGHRRGVRPKLIRGC